MNSLYCGEKYLKKGGRKAVKMELSEFEGKLRSKFENPEESYYFEPLMFEDRTICKDLSKIDFDTENITSQAGEFRDNGGNLVGFHTLKGIPFLGCLAGGDGDEPIFFIVYWDGKKFRGYIPTAGNLFDKDDKVVLDGMFDSEKDGYIHDFLKKYSNVRDVEKFLDNRRDQITGYYMAGAYGKLEYDWDWIARDIQSRIIAE